MNIFRIFVISFFCCFSFALMQGNGTPDEPYQISTEQHLQQVNDNLSANYILTADIELNQSYTSALIASDPDEPFTGSFNGNGFSIKNLVITGSSTGAGLFGNIDYASIYSLGVEDITISGGYRTGGLAGYASRSIINDCFTTGIVESNGARVGGLIGDNWGNQAHPPQVINSYSTAYVSGSERVGGLIGHASSASFIENCYAEGDVYASVERAGGLIGNTFGSTVAVTIKSSYATGDVKTADYLGGLVGQHHYTTTVNSYATGNLEGLDRVGGLVGQNYAGTIENCYALGNVEGLTLLGGLVGNNTVGQAKIINSYAAGDVVQVVGYPEIWGNRFGGLVGRNANASVVNSYATGNVSGYANIGGLVGINESTGTIQYSYSLGYVNGTDDAGGFAGTNNNTINTSFWNTETSGKTSGVGNDNSDNGTTGLTDEQMLQSSIFVNSGWDFNDIWLNCDGFSYPKLFWQEYALSDFNLDGEVNIKDLKILSSRWLDNDFQGICADINSDGEVNLLDYSVFSEQWTGEHYSPIISAYNFGQYQHKVQLHTHTANSFDAESQPSWVMQMYQWLGFTAVAITDHCYGPNDWRDNSPSLEDPQGHSIVFIPGVEYSGNNSGSTYRHMVGINIKSIHNSDGGGNRQAQINQARMEGGLTYLCHPSDNNNGWPKQHLLSLVNGYDGIEIHNGGYYHEPGTDRDYPYKIDYVLQAGRRINLIAVDDYHSGWASRMDRGFVVVNSDKCQDTINRYDIVAALRKGNFFAAGRLSTSDPVPPRFTNITVNGSTIHVETDKQTDIEFITARANYYKEGANYVQKNYGVTQAQYNAINEDKFVRIKATYNEDGKISYAWSNPLYISDQLPR